MSDAQAAQDPVTPLVAEARSTLERVVAQLARRRCTDERRLRAVSKKKTRQCIAAELVQAMWGGRSSQFGQC
jgi:hypothetical protein